MRRYITLANGKKVSLGSYVNGVKKAKANPEAQFDCGLTTWWPCTGAEIVAQFREGMHERINARVPYADRGAA